MVLVLIRASEGPVNRLRHVVIHHLAGSLKHFVASRTSEHIHLPTTCGMAVHRGSLSKPVSRRCAFELDGLENESTMSVLNGDVGAPSQTRSLL